MREVAQVLAPVLLWLAMPACATQPTRAPDSPEARLAALEARVGGRLGVAALDTGSGRRLAHRSGERFPMCSTFKVLLAGATLARVDAGREALERSVSYGKTDLLDYAPVIAARVEEGRLTVGELCAAAVEVSDNGAANLLLRELGGPDAVTAFVRTLGDAVTRLDRVEPELNEALPEDPRDTTTPQAMLADLKTLLLGTTLDAASRAKLEGWMVACKTGGQRLRAGLPTDWVVGDKTGSGARGTVNDVAVLWPPHRAPIVVTAYFTGSTVEDRNAVLAEVGRIVAAAFEAPGPPRAR